ncbi:MAG: signal peptidase II [Chloroflexi bacterium]|nr:MAG: signal peptidase II [Chloroflexota bacterium]
MAGMSSRTAAGLAAGVALAVLAADQASKAWARSTLPPGRDVPIVSGWVWFRVVTNSGASFGLLSGHNWLFIVLTLVVVLAVGVLVLRSQVVGALGVAALGAIAGGGASNLLDRIRLGSVTDFIEIHRWPTNFNLADAAIRIGVVLFIVALLLEMRRDRRPG